MQKKIVLALFCALFVAVNAVGAQKTDEDPVKKLSPFLGKWHTEGIFDNGTRAKSELECRWSPEGRYLVCEQDVSLSSGHSHQLTIYGYEEKAGKYTFVTLTDNAAKPAGGFVEIKGNMWAYDLTLDDAKGTQVRTTNEFTNPKTELFKTYISNDHGATWNLTLQGTAHKLGD